MPNSLEVLAGNLTKDKFNATQKCFGDRSELMLRKRGYPYDYMDGPTKLEETQLPLKEEFYSKLQDAHITDEQYAHAQRVFKAFSCQNMLDYHNLYLESDVAILEDVFEDFGDMCIKHYKLDPAHYFTSPGLAYDAALKFTGVRLELLSDPDMLLMFENTTSRGVAMIFH